MIRLKPATRDGLPVIQLDVLEPVASHSTALSVIGRAVLIPAAQVEAICSALARVADYAPDAADKRVSPRRSRPPAPEPEF